MSPHLATLQMEKELSLKASTRDLRHQTFALVVPTLNEAGNIERVLRQIQNALEPLHFLYEVIVVDDGSTDGVCREVLGDTQSPGSAAPLFL